MVQWDPSLAFYSNSKLHPAPVDICTRHTPPVKCLFIGLRNENKNRRQVDGVMSLKATLCVGWKRPNTKQDFISQS